MESFKLEGDFPVEKDTALASENIQEQQMVAEVSSNQQEQQKVTASFTVKTRSFLCYSIHHSIHF